MVFLFLKKIFLRNAEKKSSSKTSEQKIIYTLQASCFFCVLLISIKHKLCREPSIGYSYQVGSNWRDGFREED